jgi:hypothetical protein
MDERLKGLLKKAVSLPRPDDAKKHHGEPTSLKLLHRTAGLLFSRKASFNNLLCTSNGKAFSIREALIGCKFPQQPGRGTVTVAAQEGHHISIRAVIVTTYCRILAHLWHTCCTGSWPRIFLSTATDFGKLSPSFSFNTL